MFSGLDLIQVLGHSETILTIKTIPFIHRTYSLVLLKPKIFNLYDQKRK